VFCSLFFLIFKVRDAKLAPIRCVYQPFRDTVYSDMKVPEQRDDFVRAVDCISCEPNSVLNVKEK
jgi:hypothetical protein